MGGPNPAPHAQQLRASASCEVTALSRMDSLGFLFRVRLAPQKFADVTRSCLEGGGDRREGQRAGAGVRESPGAAGRGQLEGRRADAAQGAAGAC